MNNKPTLTSHPTRLAWWSRQHAMITIFGLGTAFFEPSAFLLVTMMAASLLGLSRIPDPLGWSQFSTIFRILGTFDLILDPPTSPEAKALLIGAIMGFGVLEIVLDRLMGQHGEKRRLLEQEADAIVLLGLLLLAAPSNPLGKHILWLGLVRPLIVLPTHWEGPPRSTMPWNRSVRLSAQLSLSAWALLQWPEISVNLTLGLSTLGVAAWIWGYGTWISRLLDRRRSEKIQQEQSVRSESDRQALNKEKDD